MIYGLILAQMSLVVNEIHGDSELVEAKGGGVLYANWSKANWNSHGVLLLLLSFDLAVQLYARTVFGYFSTSVWNTVYFCSLLTLTAVHLCGSQELFLDVAFLRSLLLMSRRSRLRNNISTIMRTLPSTWHVWYLMLCVILFYSGIGKILFSGQYDFSTCEQAGLNTWAVYDHIPTASLALLVLSTTENYPYLMLPAYYNGSKTVAICYHASFTVFAVFILKPILLAVVYDRWKETRLAEAVNDRLTEYQALLAAYSVLTRTMLDRQNTSHEDKISGEYSKQYHGSTDDSRYAEDSEEREGDGNHDGFSNDRDGDVFAGPLLVRVRVAVEVLHRLALQPLSELSKDGNSVYGGGKYCSAVGRMRSNSSEKQKQTLEHPLIRPEMVLVQLDQQSLEGVAHVEVVGRLNMIMVAHGIRKGRRRVSFQGVAGGPTQQQPQQIELLLADPQVWQRRLLLRQRRQQRQQARMRRRGCGCGKPRPLDLPLFRQLLTIVQPERTPAQVAHMFRFMLSTSTETSTSTTTVRGPGPATRLRSPSNAAQWSGGGRGRSRVKAQEIVLKQFMVHLLDVLDFDSFHDSPDEDGDYFDYSTPGCSTPGYSTPEQPTLARSGPQGGPDGGVDGQDGQDGQRDSLLEAQHGQTQAQYRPRPSWLEYEETMAIAAAAVADGGWLDKAARIVLAVHTCNVLLAGTFIGSGGDSCGSKGIFVGCTIFFAVELSLKVSCGHAHTQMYARGSGKARTIKESLSHISVSIARGVEVVAVAYALVAVLASVISQPDDAADNGRHGPRSLHHPISSINANLALSQTLLLLRLLTLSPSILRTLEGLMAVWREVFVFFASLLVVTYFYAALGIRALHPVREGGYNHGKTHSGESMPPDMDNMDQGMSMNSCDTFGHCFLMLFQIWTENDWNDILYPNIYQFGPHGQQLLVVLYWTSYFWLINFVVVNVLTALMLDAFTKLQAVLDQQRVQFDDSSSNNNSRSSSSSSSSRQLHCSSLYTSNLLTSRFRILNRSSTSLHTRNLTSWQQQPGRMSSAQAPLLAKDEQQPHGESQPHVAGVLRQRRQFASNGGVTLLAARPSNAGHGSLHRGEGAGGSRGGEGVVKDRGAGEINGPREQRPNQSEGRKQGGISGMSNVVRSHVVLSKASARLKAKAEAVMAQWESHRLEQRWQRRWETVGMAAEEVSVLEGLLNDVGQEEEEEESYYPGITHGNNKREEDSNNSRSRVGGSNSGTSRSSIGTHGRIGDQQQTYEGQEGEGGWEEWEEEEEEWEEQEERERIVWRQTKRLDLAVGVAYRDRRRQHQLWVVDAVLSAVWRTVTPLADRVLGRMICCGSRSRHATAFVPASSHSNTRASGYSSHTGASGRGGILLKRPKCDKESATATSAHTSDTQCQDSQHYSSTAAPSVTPSSVTSTGSIFCPPAHLSSGGGLFHSPSVAAGWDNLGSEGAAGGRQYSGGSDGVGMSGGGGRARSGNISVLGATRAGLPTPSGEPALGVTHVTN
jgi:hypothetical protein